MLKSVATPAEQTTSVAASISVKAADGINLPDQSIVLELVSSELDPKTRLEKKTTKGYARRVSHDEDDIKYECDFVVPKDFGEIGAILVENGHHKEMYLDNITLDGLQDDTLIVNCNSWVASKSDNPEKRVFFTNKSYLPSQTPNGLKRLREKDLAENRGNGQGERKTYDRIYDYDMYNDLGNPDSDIGLKRPVLGGKEHPYPRRCRTGRARTKKDPLSESRSSDIYVPRDEAFSDVKNRTFSAKTVYSVLHAVVPSLETAIVDENLGFPYFTRIDSLFNEGVNIPELKNNSGFLRNLLPRIIKFVGDAQADLLQFETPAMYEKDKFSWFRDEEFSRQTLAGINPYSIQLVKEWPLKSQLDPKIYGPPESAITAELVETEIKGFMTVEEAVKQKKLFMLDYHDLLMPYVRKVREIKGTTLYGSRTLFFLTPTGTLRPLAIELTRPPMDGKPQWNQVFTPCWDATGTWLWRLAKTHVLAHDSGYHQLDIFLIGQRLPEIECPPKTHLMQSGRFSTTSRKATLLSCFPTQIQAAKVMAVLDVLSNHSPDEEYIGAEIEGVWADNPTIKAAFERFSGKLKELDGIIDARNANRSLKNRNGAGVVPYELLKPYSEPGVTGKGVPNSISI
ncbi:lipoxygenase 2 [Actinidia rufa]|uniref:Lipoxygenase 2 n=1 Tax=Actinidia rufa TaxID=165716 RepID=A0A7J0HCB3_9ERIC|nr:lipoxygenase 2 [Actinidia rufa]